MKIAEKILNFSDEILLTEGKGTPELNKTIALYIGTILFIKEYYRKYILHDF